MVEIGEQIPKVKLIDTELKPVSLPKAAKGKTTVLAFFPGAFTGVCTKEMCTFRDGMSRFADANASVYAISVDSPFSNKQFKDLNSINFPILSDLRKQAIKRFGIVQKDFAHVKGYIAAKRSVFILDSEGIVRYRWISDNPGIEPDYQEIEKALKSIK